MNTRSDKFNHEDTSNALDAAYGCYEKGLACLNGTGRAKNAKLAMQFFQEAADEGLVEAMYELGRCHLSGTLSTHQPKKGFALILEAAEAGFAPAMFEAGLCYKNGVGTKRNLKEAKKCLISAQQQGADGAECELKQVEEWMKHPKMIPIPPPNDGRRLYILNDTEQGKIKFFGKLIDKARWEKKSGCWTDYYTYHIYLKEDARYIVEATKKAWEITNTGGGGGTVGFYTRRKVKTFKDLAEATQFALYGFSHYYPPY